MLLPEKPPSRLLTIEAHHRDDRYFICPEGEVDGATAGQLGAAIRTAEATDAQRIVVDLTGVTFMDNSGVHLILDACARARRDSDRLSLVRGPRRVHRVFVLVDTAGQLPFLDP